MTLTCRLKSGLATMQASNRSHHASNNRMRMNASISHRPFVSGLLSFAHAFGHAQVLFTKFIK
jgi:hypothetical protein